MDSDNGLNVDLWLTESTFLKNYHCSFDNVLWSFFGVAILICHYLKKKSYNFCVLGTESTRNWRIYFFVEILGLHKIFISEFFLCF